MSDFSVNFYVISLYRHTRIPHRTVSDMTISQMKTPNTLTPFQQRHAEGKSSGSRMTTDLDEKLELNMKSVQEKKTIYLGRGGGFTELLKGILGKFTFNGKCVKSPEKSCGNVMAQIDIIQMLIN